MLRRDHSSSNDAHSSSYRRTNDVANLLLHEEKRALVMGFARKVLELDWKTIFSCSGRGFVSIPFSGTAKLEALY